MPRSLTEQFVSKRLTKRQGNDVLKNTLEDILKILLYPALTFYAVDLLRLPPVRSC